MLAQFVSQQLNRWLDKRIPVNNEVVLTQRKIFIVPTLQALFFLTVIILLLIAAINYQNNLIYIIVFFLLSLFNTAIIFTYHNMSTLSLRKGRVAPVFQGEYSQFEIEAHPIGKKQHHDIKLMWPDQPLMSFDCIASRRVLPVHYLSLKRGVLKPGRVKILSDYPLGLLRCWSWVDLGFEAIVFPKPIFLPEHHSQADVSGTGRMEPALGQEDFYGFKNYSAGDQRHHLNWRSVAKGQPLTTKVYAAQQSEQQWVDWFLITEPSVERRLSIMCGWVLSLDKLSIPFGLRLPGLEIQPSQGEKHIIQVLTALAIFEVADAN